MFNFNNKNYREDDIYVNEIDDLIGEINLIDIRERHEFRAGSIKSAKNIPMDNFLDNPEKYMNKDEKYYILCRSGSRSDSACRILRKDGYNVINVSGGVANYEGEHRTE
ncbi:MAG: rhodanese-like domain-containing protein [Clostridium sp.]|uniref:rhodanese-like domain-containing protein n=1 Tax=Clostridium sp. TaxID=1506 RepID=UPI0030655D19